MLLESRLANRLGAASVFVGTLLFAGAATGAGAPAPAGSESLTAAPSPLSAPNQAASLRPPTTRRSGFVPSRSASRRAHTRVPAGAFNFGYGLRVRPGSIHLAESRCSPWFSSIRWTRWTRASAVGRALLNEPRNGQNCPEMRKNRSITPTTIRLTRTRVCAGDRVFIRITWTSAQGRLRAFDSYGCAED